MNRIGLAASRGLQHFVGLVSGPPSRRHRSRAALSSLRNIPAFRSLVGRLRSESPGSPIVVVALVGHLGDIVAAEPIPRFLSREHPGCRIIWVVGRAYRELVEGHPDVETTFPVGCETEWSGLAARCDLSRILGPGGRVVDLHIHMRSCGTCLAYHSRTPNPSGIDITNYYHFGNLLQIFCKVGGLPELDEGPRVYPSEGCRTVVDELGLPTGFVAIHCRSNQEARDWTDANWRELANRLISDYGIPVVELGLRPVVAGTVRGCVDLCGRLSLLETAEVIRRAGLFVGIDSGPAHLANAAGTPGVVLLGHYRRYQRYVPYSGAYAEGRNAELIHGEGPASSIPVERALDAVIARLPIARR